jgi:hypothetical protein
VGLEQGPLSLVRTTEELLGRKSNDFGLESREYGRRNPSRLPRDTFHPQKLALNSLTSGGRSVGIVRSKTRAMSFRSVGVYKLRGYNLCRFLEPLVISSILTDPQSCYSKLRDQVPCPHKTVDKVIVLAHIKF